MSFKPRARKTVHVQRMVRRLIVFLVSSFSVIDSSSHLAVFAGPHMGAASGTQTDKAGAKINQIVEKLKSPKSIIKLEAIAKIQALPPSAVAPTARETLISLLAQDKDRDVRAAAAEALGAFAADDSVMKALLRAMDSDPDATTRWRAANAIPAGKKYLPYLLKGMESKDPGLRVRMVDKFRLEPVDDPDAVMAIMDLLRDSDASVRGSAAEALAIYGPKARMTEPALMHCLLNEPSQLSRNFEIRALSRVGSIRQSDLPGLRAALDQNRNSAFRMDCVRTMAWLGPKASPAIDQILDYMNRNRDPKFLAVASDTLASIGPSAHRSVPILVRELTDPRKDTFKCHYAAALGAVASKNDTAAVEALETALTNGDSETRKAAAKSLEKLQIKPTRRRSY